MNYLETFSGYSVDSIAAAEAFYRDTLGLTVERTKEGLEIKTPNQTIFLYEKSSHKPAEFTVFNLVVADIDAAVTDLKAKGMTFETYDGMHQDEQGIARGKEVGMGPDIAWFKDPAGNILSVLAKA
ncbi:MAG: VOC family protein [Patescibacteria group bacterium]